MKTLREYIDLVDGKETREQEIDRKFNSPEQLKKDADYRAYRKAVKASRKQPPAPLPEGMAEYDRRRKLQSQISKIESIDFYITDDDGLIIAGPFEGRSDATEAFERLVRQRQDINIIQGRALIVKLAGMREGVAEGFKTPEWPDQRALPTAVAKLLLQYAKQNKKSIKQLIKLPPVNLVDVLDAVDPAFAEDNLEHLSDNDFNWVFSKATQKIAKSIQQGVAEEATPEAIARIEQLASNK